jgi:hypothetical protein
MSEKPRKFLYEDQDKIWSEAREFLLALVANKPSVQEALVWASLAEGQFGLYEKEYRGQEGSDIDLVVIINENYPLPGDWKFTTVEKSCFSLYRIGKFFHRGHKHPIDGLLVFPTRHDLQEVRDMLADRSKSIYLKEGRSILTTYNIHSEK